MRLISVYEILGVGGSRSIFQTLPCVMSSRSLLFSFCFLLVWPSAMLTGKLKLAIILGTSMMEKTLHPPTADS